MFNDNYKIKSPIYLLICILIKKKKKFEHKKKIITFFFFLYIRCRRHQGANSIIIFCFYYNFLFSQRVSLQITGLCSLCAAVRLISFKPFRHAKLLVFKWSVFFFCFCFYMNDLLCSLDLQRVLFKYFKETASSDLSPALIWL